MRNDKSAGNKRPRPNVSIKDCKLIEFPKITDPRGSLTFVEGLRHIPFTIARVFYLYDIPSGARRAGHAHKTLHQVLIAISGNFDVFVDDGSKRREFNLDSGGCGLHIPSTLWCDLDNFAPGSVCLVLASACYSEDDYYRDYKTFVSAKKNVR